MSVRTLAASDSSCLTACYLSDIEGGTSHTSEDKWATLLPGLYTSHLYLNGNSSISEFTDTVVSPTTENVPRRDSGCTGQLSSIYGVYVCHFEEHIFNFNLKQCFIQMQLQDKLLGKFGKKDF